MNSPLVPARAAALCIELINPEVMQVAERHPDGDGSRHMAWMLKEIAKGQMSIGKGNRWLGWAQCLMMIYNHASLEQIKEINRKVGHA